MLTGSQLALEHREELVATVRVNVAEFGNFQDAAPAVAESAHEDHQIEYACDVPSNFRWTQLREVAADQKLESGQRVGAAAGVDRRRRAIMPGVEGFQDIEGFLAVPDFADD